MARCLIGLGANLGEPQATLRAVARTLSEQAGITHFQMSALHSTRPVGGPSDQPDYVNAAALFETTLSPDDVLSLLHQCEAQNGRERLQRWGPRTLDLDLLLYDQEVCATPRLTVPHPRLAFRRFVLEPAVQIAGEMLHPTIRSTLSQLLTHVNSAPRYVALAGACWFAKQYVCASAIAGLKASGTSVHGLTTRGITVLGAPPIADPDHSFVEHYVELMPRLAGELRSAVARPEDWLIANYWPDELALGARLWFSGAAQEAAERAYAEAFAGIPQPQLLVYLSTPDDLLLFSPTQPEHDARYYEQAGRLAAQRDALDQHIATVQGLPLLRLSAERPEAAIREVMAAVVALVPR